MDEARLQEMWDHHEIRQLLATYCHGCDRGDEVEMASVYCEDSWDDHGPRKMDGHRFSFETIEESIRTTRVVSHQLGQSLIKVDGDRAGAETYFIASLIYPLRPGEAVESLNQLGGRYVDTFERIDGKWLVKKRICVREWSISHPINHDFLARAGFVETARGAADVSYEALRQTPAGKLLGQLAARA